MTTDRTYREGNFLMSLSDWRKYISGEWTEKEMEEAYPQYKRNKERKR